MTQMTQKNMYIIGGVVALVVVVLLIAFWMANTGNVNAPGSQSITENPPESTQDTTGETAPAGLLSYNQALALYKDKRIQLNVDANNYCTVIPSNVVYKEGTKVMFDNRDNKAVTFSLDGVKYSIKAYGFRIITLATSATLPHNISIDCGTGQNNGTINLQQ